MSRDHRIRIVVGYKLRGEARKAAILLLCENPEMLGRELGIKLAMLERKKGKP